MPKKLASSVIVIVALAVFSYAFYPRIVEQLTLFRLQNAGYHFVYFIKKGGYVCSVTPSQMRALENTKSTPSRLVSTLSDLGYRVEVTEYVQGPAVQRMTLDPSKTPERNFHKLEPIQREP